MVSDPWLDGLRASDAFIRVLADVEARHRAAADAYRTAGGESVLGPA